jgi:hypothetical protein
VKFTQDIFSLYRGSLGSLQVSEVYSGYIYSLGRIIGKLTGELSSFRIYFLVREDHWEAYK